MTPTEMNAVLTFAALLDPRMKRSDPAEAADRAEAWALAVPDEVTVEAARAAVAEHYQQSRDALMVADLIALAGVEAAAPLGIDGDAAWDAELARRAREIDA